MKLNYLNNSVILLTLLAMVVNFLPLHAQTQVQIAIDASSIRKAVSPYIYGRNNSLSDNPGNPVSSSNWTLYRDAGLNMFRDGGGNNSTKYNWRKKLSSHPDWYNNVYAHDWDYATSSLQQNIPYAQEMWTLQLIGKTASKNDTNFNDWKYNNSQWWTGCEQNLAGGGKPNPAGGSKALVEGNPNLYLEDWPADSVVGILTNWFGKNGLGYDKSKLLYWNMDNEPEIWSGTHDDVMPVQISAEAFMQRYFETAKKARALFPEIKLVGPVPANEWQWYNWNGDRISYYENGKYNYYTWLEYFIKRIEEERQATGIRLLDVLDIHFYPGETAATDIVQLHRVFFDRTYVYPGNNGVHRLGISGWDSTINKEYIFGRCQEWLDKYMGAGNGVTFSVTETGINTSDANVRAVWYASTLGEFAKQGVEIFTPWSWGVGMYEVVHLFSKYNHANYINAVSSEEKYVSAYPTITTQADSMTVVLVNRSVDSTKVAQVLLSNFTLTDGPVNYYRLSNLTSTETFMSDSSNALKTGTVTPSGNVLLVSLPPLSITSLILKSAALFSVNIPDSENADTKLSVYPNPAVSSCTISWPQGINGTARMEVLSTSGQIVFAQALDGQALSLCKLRINTQRWPSGIYFVRLKSQRNLNSVEVSILH